MGKTLAQSVYVVTGFRRSGWSIFYFFQTFETSKAREGKQISDNIAEIGSERHEIEKQVSDFSIAQAQSIGSQADQKRRRPRSGLAMWNLPT
jgi:hypothetical protein